jgi:hypothetical protein
MRHYTTKVDTFFDFTNTHLHKYFHCPIPPDFDVSNGYVVIGYVRRFGAGIFVFACFYYFFTLSIYPYNQ